MEPAPFVLKKEKGLWMGIQLDVCVGLYLVVPQAFIVRVVTPFPSCTIMTLATVGAPTCGSSSAK